MRSVRPIILALLALAVAVAAIGGATAQSQTSSVALPGGGKVKVKLPGKGKRTNTVQLGIAEEKSPVFTDPLFLELGMKIARRTVAWDTFQYEWQIGEVHDWMMKARAAGIQPLISFNRSRVAERRHMVPSRRQWLAMFKDFRARYPWVRDFVASNESNHTPPGAKNPKRAAQYYKDMKKACRQCRIAAATINEQPKKKFMETWIKKFIRAAGHRPKIWALHNYYGANTFSLKFTKRFLKATKTGEVWVTEVGGLVKRRSANFAGKLKMREGRAHSTRAWKYILNRMISVDRRIKRVYLFHWNNATARDSWDSALVSHDGKPRPGLAVLRNKLRKGR